ncbi:MAG: DUF4838 domain-containing protein [Chthoniobacteraceae bacterium]
MKLLTSLLFSLAFAATAISQTKAGGDDAPEDMILGFRGKSKYQIVVPDAAANAAAESSVTRAAELLQQAFAANAIKLEVRKESEAEAARPGFYLGATKFAAANGVDAKRLGGWSYVHKAVGRHIIIAGNDAPDTLVGKRATIRKDVTIPYEGTLFGMAEFVYRYAGARFLSPGNNGTAFVPTSIIHVPGNLNTNGSPFFIEHDLRNSPDLFFTANHCLGFQRIWSRWGHQHPSAVPISQYGKDHPEYFILAGGVRQPALTMKDGEGQLCLSNPDVRELIYKHLLERCDEGFDIVELGQADGFRSCQCSKCAELYGVTPDSVPTDGSAYNIWGEKIWIMHRDMALRLLKDRPGKRIMMSAYSVAAPPPRTFNEFPPNTIIEMMDSSEKAFEAWKTIKVPGGYSAYLYNWGALHLKGLTVAQIAAQNDRLVTNNVHVVQVNGIPRPGQWGLEGPNIYIYLRLGIEPFTKSADELFNEYLQAAFRESEPQMRRFFITFQKRVALLETLKEYTSKIERDPIFTLGTLYTPDLINAMEEDLTQAEKNAQLPEVKTRLDIVRYEFDFLKHTVLVINAYRNHQAMNDAASLNQLLNTVDARNKFVAAVVNGDAKYPKWKNPAFPQRNEPDLKFAQTYMDRAPFNWDTAKMRANPAQLSRQTKSLEIAKVSETLTLDSPRWKSAEEHTLGPVEDAATALQAKTTFRVLCDDGHLYVRVSGEQPAGKMKFVTRGHDAELWLQESIIVNVSPSGDRSRYFYFAYEPEPTSFNDAEHGFITDVLHPRYGWNDESWNGKWTFETKLLPDKNRWESMAVIPFETFRVAAPKKGDMWYLNVGRVHFIDAAEKKDQRENSVWTGKLNASRIPGDASFGTATFK